MAERETQEKQSQEDDVDAYFDQLSQGEPKKKVSELNQLATGPAKETVKTIVFEAINKGLLPRHALRLEDDTMEAIYSQAYTLYNQGKYQEASYVFRLLMLLDYMTQKYMLGLAACLHRMKEYKNAANIYMLCSTLDSKNPLPYYHSADCYLQMDLPEMASFSLGMVMEVAGDQPQYAVIKERARLMKETLDQELNEKATQQTETLPFEEAVAKKGAKKEEKKTQKVKEKK